MMTQMKTLLRVKELKLDKALNAMQEKRRQQEAAQAASRLASDNVNENAATYDAREEAIYAAVLGKVIDLAEIDATHGRVVQLEKEKILLEDALERALHVEARVQDELDTATKQYFVATNKRDKFVFLTEDLQQASNAQAELEEEIEVEDLFARPRGQLA